MPRGGARAGAGRPRKNPIAEGAAPSAQPAKSAAAPEKDPSYGNPQPANAQQTPLDFMLAVMRDPNATHAQRMQAAAYAAPFLHPRKADSSKGKKGQAEEGAQESTAEGNRFAPMAPPKLRRAA